MSDDPEADLADLRKTPEERQTEQIRKINRQIAWYIEKNLNKDPTAHGSRERGISQGYDLPNHPYISTLILGFDVPGMHIGVGNNETSLSSLSVFFKSGAAENYLIYKDPKSQVEIAMKRPTYTFYFNPNGDDSSSNAGSYWSQGVNDREATRQQIIEIINAEDNPNRPLTVSNEKQFKSANTSSPEDYIYTIQNYNYHEFIMQALAALHEQFPDQYPSFKDFAKSEPADQTT